MIIQTNIGLDNNLGKHVNFCSLLRYYSWEKSTKQSNAEVLRSMELPLAREIELQRLLLNKDAALMKLFDLYEDDLKTLRKILM